MASAPVNAASIEVLSRKLSPRLNTFPIDPRADFTPADAGLSAIGSPPAPARLRDMMLDVLLPKVVAVPIAVLTSR